MSIYIIGAGFAGRTIAKEILAKGIYGPISAFLDDDPGKIGTHIEQAPVLGPVDDVLDILSLSAKDEALIAMPSAPRERIREIFAHLKRAGFPRIRILPDVGQIIEGEAHLVQTRELDLQDLLGRKPLRIGLKQSLGYLKGKRVLISGAGGSIGSEIARQLLHGGAERLYLLGHGENSIYEIDRELRLLQQEGVGEEATIVPVIGELQDPDFTNFIMERLRADVVFHAAAYKHVPMMEENPVNAIKNNVFGTLNLLRASRVHGVKRFVLISTDKAVNPRSIYGASKKIAEAIVLSEGQKTQADFRSMVVRFGNVLGSRGSIIPLFREQIRTGGPVTITHPEVSRFFMTIPEAVSLVLKAGGVGKNSGLYLLDMGEPVFIRDIAEQLIRFHGFEPHQDIPIRVIGLRKGEKLTETLTEDFEHARTTEFPKILEVQNSLDWTGKGLADFLEQLYPVCYRSSQQPEKYRDRKLLRRILASRLPDLPENTDEPQF
ncbi:polysaccharide biosynthesis protein [Spirochaeta lutea]|uniref:polysaccharide biosynthesis protein n=1 Tax=Spirochaeta lutea TaxID=1480694 RepID=UPI0005642BA9|nr:nucleoside-diphosphate sugar epimerase/dehydratase [Spirochaeta lutea]